MSEEDVVQRVAEEAIESSANDRSIVEIMEGAYLDYSMSVIVSRALPDVRDGLKPVQRRILYAMLREGLIHNRPFDKCAGVIGEVLKNYHPHGDSSVYDALVRLAQPWVMRYPLLQSQGNFGSIDGDPPAAYRYTECKLDRMAEDLLRDLDEDTVDYMPNYKESTQEPTVLPGALPNLLLNGSTGIAVGMTTNIPPHNLLEIIDALLVLIDAPHTSLDGIVKIIQGPDFPTGGEIVGVEGIRKYLRTGRGIIRVRGKVHCEEMKSGREQIVIDEIPYNVNRATLVEKIAELVTAKELDEVSDIRDESTENTRIVLELKRGEPSRVVTNKLFRHTTLENSFGVILLALDRKRPKQMNIKEILELYLEHRRDVVSRRTQFRLRKASQRAHVLEGFRVALNHLDDFVRIIRGANDRDSAKRALMEKYNVTEVQADAVLELRLYQLTGLERAKVEDELGELRRRIQEYEGILASQSQLMTLIRKELVDIRATYGDQRHTKIVPAEGEFSIEDVISNEGCVITISNKGFIKRTAVDSYHTQRRGGKGVMGAKQHEDDFIEHIFSANTHSYILFFMNNGRLYVQKVYDIPEAARTAKGRSLVNLLNMHEGERIAAMICAKDFASEQNVVMCTRKGVIKKTALSNYRNFRRDGIIGINIDEDDVLIAAHLTAGEDEIVIVTRNGMSVKFNESDLRVQGRATRGVRGISLRKGDAVKMMTVVEPETTMLLATENGLGKRSHFEDYRLQRRGGLGIIAMRAHAPICSAVSVREDEQIMMVTRQGQAVRSKVSDIRVIGRTTQGVRLINLAPGDVLIGVSRVVEIEGGEE
ncbi:MAG: DNA gyrase subunit A [Puniceicoccales bacterium]|jgi:DNA gyrase subunit A|nr:DNA gyrase subunit A [Puniceicoccales bacterium]